MDNTVDGAHPFGTALRQHREAAGLSLSALAQRLGDRLGRRIDPQKVNGWELRHLPNISERRETVEALEELLGVPDRELLDLAGLIVADPSDGERLTRLESEVREMRGLLEELLGAVRRQAAG